MEIQELERKLKHATHETSAFWHKETEESIFVEELQKKHSCIKESIQEKEDKVVIQERRLSAFVKGCNQQMLNIQEDGERRGKERRFEKSNLEKHLEILITNNPKQQDSEMREMDELKAKHSTEIELADVKIQALMKSKQTLLEGASEKLLCLRRQTANVEIELDEARKVTVLAGDNLHK